MSVHCSVPLDPSKLVPSPAWDLSKPRTVLRTVIPHSSSPPPPRPSVLQLFPTPVPPSNPPPIDPNDSPHRSTCGVSPPSHGRSADMISESGAASFNMNPFLPRIIRSRPKPPYEVVHGASLPSFHIGPSAEESRKGGHGTQHTGPWASLVFEGRRTPGGSLDEVRRRVRKQAWRLALAGALRSSPGGQPCRQHP